MKIDLSKEAINIIKTELETADNEITWELAKLPLYKTDTPQYAYWKQRQQTIKHALSELRKVT
jgi:hypothetical protein